MIELNINQVNQFILYKHHLTTDSKINDIITITDDLCGLHGTGTLEPYLSLFGRMNHFYKEDLDDQLYIKKNLGRIRGMRKTLFIETKKMIPIVHNLIRPQTILRDDKYLQYTGISKEEYKIISKQIMTLLAKKDLSTNEIKEILGSKKNIAAIVSVMCDEMLIIRGKPIKSWRDRRIQYAPFDSYFPDIDFNTYNENHANKVLAEKYIRIYGPVTEEDIVWWLGITKTKVRKAMDNFVSNLETIRIKGLEPEYMLFRDGLNGLSKFNTKNLSIISILPSLDPYIMGYKNRQRYVDPAIYDYVFDRTGNGTSTILYNGTVIGIWDFLEKPELCINIYLFNDINPKILEKIKIECHRVGKFLSNKDVRVKECSKMISLTERTLGGFMSPLKEC